MTGIGLLNVFFSKGFILARVKVDMVPVQGSWGTRQNYTLDISIAGHHAHRGNSGTFNVASPITGIFFGEVGKLEKPEEIHTLM